MKKASCAALLLAVAPFLQGCFDVSIHGPSLRTVTGSGTIISETRSLSGFDRVSVSGSGELTLIQGDEESLTIEADDNVIPEIRSEVNDGRLQIGPDRVSLRPSKTINYTLKLKNLSELGLSGSLSATSDRLTSEELECAISGSGKIRIEKLEAGDFSVRISGSGSTTVAGQADRQQARISGSGDYHAADLAGKSVEIHISGSGNAAVWAEEHLNVQVSGSGNVKYYGSPQVTQNVSGSGSVRSLGAK